MYTGTYDRCSVSVHDSNLTLLRRGRAKLKKGAFLRDRESVKAFYRQLLDCHENARELFAHYRF